MITELLRAFIFIFIAEMGDKTQILAMAFATKYNIKKVLLGIFIGSLLNHGLAVLLGNSLTRIIDPSTLQIIAGFAFILFALWSLKMNDDEESVKKKVKYGPVVTVSIAFFIGELG
ncbi:MAG: TMEM165/GDT1 family protein, partial [Candidatus Izemoplasma sp.]